MSSRSWHRKSRNGCGQCKKRHVKCDLQAPVCSNCAKRGQPCDYQLLHTDSPSSRRHNQTLQPTNQQLIPNPTGTDVWSFFQTSPSMLFSFVDGQTHAWDSMIIQQTHKQAFLKHAIVGLSTLFHLQGSPSVSKQGYITACTHHIEASSAFRNAASASTEIDWIARLVYALTVIIFQFRVVATQPDADCITEALLVLRSAARFAQSVAPCFIQHQRSLPYEPGDQGGPLEPEVLHAITGLEQLVDDFEWEVDAKAAYEESVKTLKQWIGMNRGQPRTWLHMISWPASLSPKYVHLLAQKQPVALIIFLHWCTIMVRAPKRWFLDSWAVNLASQALGALDTRWNPHVEWPSAIFGMEAGANLVTNVILGATLEAKPEIYLKEATREMDAVVDLIQSEN